MKVQHDDTADDIIKEEPERMREVKYRHSTTFTDILRELQSTLLISTYQAGKLVTIGVHDNALQFAFHQFEQAMGMAVSRERMAIGAKGQVWFLQNNSQIAPSIAPNGRYDGCYLTRTAMATGSIHCHEICWSDDELWVVNTLFSCLCTLHEDFNFVPRWQPPFIKDLIAEDRCHLNGLAMDHGHARFVTVMAESNQAAGWREKKSTSGCILDVASGGSVTRGLAMPHSPRWYQNRLWVLNSGHGALEVVDVATGKRDVVARMPGYTRGLAFLGPFAFIGLSRIRETAVFGGVPIAEKRHELKCGIGVVDLRNGQTVATFEFESGVEEIFDVQFVTGARCTYLCGPRPDQDGAQDIWIVPRADQVDSIVSRSRPPLGDGRRNSSNGTSAPVPRVETAHDWIQRGIELQRARRTQEALAVFQQALQLDPQSAEALNHIGNALQDVDRQVDAIDAYRRSVELDSQYIPALQNLGYVLVSQGFTEEGRNYLERALHLKPLQINRVLLATALPIIYSSEEDLRTCRSRIVSDVQSLVDEHVELDTTDTLVPTNFFAVYQGENDRELHANLGRIYQGHHTMAKKNTAQRGTRPRIGFLSAYFRDHTIGRLNLGRIQKLDRSKFEVTVLSVGRHSDPMAQSFASAADQFVVLPRDVAAARRLIVEQELDLLFFSDIGMDALTYSLAFSRMAPIQCVTWGHPVTTGSRSMDYFLSSELLEIPAADAHYTEKLVRRPTLSTYYHRPRRTNIPSKQRREFGLPEEAHLYLCPQTLFKMHPEFDGVLAQILRSDPAGRIVLIEGRVSNWTNLLKQRFQREMPDVAQRIQFISAQSNANFLDLMAIADVMLDPIHFGGGNTSYEALAIGIPLVTLPGEYMRSRITRALYAKIGIMDLVASSKEHYVALALELANNISLRENFLAKLHASVDVLFEDEEEVRDLEQFFTEVAC